MLSSKYIALDILIRTSAIKAFYATYFIGNTCILYMHFLLTHYILFLLSCHFLKNYFKLFFRRAWNFTILELLRMCKTRNNTNDYIVCLNIIVCRLIGLFIQGTNEYNLNIFPHKILLFND